MSDGRHLSRPESVTPASLAIATYTGPLPPDVGMLHQAGQASQPTATNVPIHLDPPHRPQQILKPDLMSTLFKPYRIRPRPKQFFTLGRVFLTLWAEPAPPATGDRWYPGTVINHLGERVFSKVRRFLVIREGDNYCNALAINTYSGRGVAKRGIDKSEHVIIFTGSTAPLPTAGESPSKGEAGMRPIPIQVDCDLDERLDPMSRLDLGGVTTVWHNIKVKPLGSVNQKSMHALRTQYAAVQNSPDADASSSGDFMMQTNDDCEDEDEEDDSEEDDDGDDDEE